jgi:ComF family protein
LFRIRSAAPYDGWVRAAILALKYEGQWARAGSLGSLMTPLLAEFGPVDALVPVPLYPDRRRERGFNQAEELARHAAAGGVPIAAGLLVRLRPTPRQVGLGAADRRANVDGAFAVDPGADVRGLRLVLVDDVLTTGATLGNCARALHDGGAGFVGALTVARE